MIEKVPEWYKKDWNQYVKNGLEFEGILRPDLDQCCDLCKIHFKKEELLEYFKVDFSEPIMDTIGLGRYGCVFCERCYRIIDMLMHQVGSF